MDWEEFYSHFREPDFIPGYEIQNRLGGGAFGEVYKARKHSIGKPYAIKFLKLDDDAQREAIERELEQVRHFAAIDHPNLVTIEDMGAVSGVPFLIMGYAGEDTLARRLREGALDPQAAMSFFVQVCRGVLALHDRRLVHFDLKPGNVFLKGDIARVGDYGLAKLMTSGRLTLSFGRGTPHYMAPEILRSRADHRADLYSLGVILYESLAGGVPFESDSPGGIVFREEDRPPEFPESFPADLRPVVERCLRLDPADRFTGVEELLTELGQAARPGDSIAVPNGFGDRPAVSVAGRARAGPGPGADQDAERAGSSSQLRSTAAELARGAAEVARGVWDGLRSVGGGATALEPPPAPARPAASAALPERTTRSAAPGPERAAPPAPPTPAADRGPGRPAPPAGTIPVPPKASDGLLGTVWTGVVLGFEVLVTLIRGLSNGVARGFGLARGRARARGGSLPRQVLRLALFLTVMAAAGVLILVVAVVFLSAADLL